MEDQNNPQIHAFMNNGQSIGLQCFDLILDDSQQVYQSGQRISGKVHLELSESINGNGINLKCKGEARVNFTDRSAGIRRKFSADESYFNDNVNLVGDNCDNCKIMSGIYPFTVTLPENLPCSFEGRYGRVRYSIRALLHVTSDHRFCSNIITFTVIPMLNLNQDSLAPLPISEEQSKIYMGQTEPLALSMFLPVRGFVPGQTMPLNLILKNFSNVIVKKFRIVFKKVVSYYALEKSRKHKEIVTEIEQPVDTGQDCYNIEFVVPSIPPSGMIHCNLIDLYYTLKVEAIIDVSEWYYRMFQKNLKIRAIIVIGTIPLLDYETPIGESKIPPLEQGLGQSFYSGMARYEESQIYRSSKPSKDDPTGDEGDSDGEVKPYSPMYRVYKFEGSKQKGSIENNVV